MFVVAFDFIVVSISADLFLEFMFWSVFVWLDCFCACFDKSSLNAGALFRVDEISSSCSALFQGFYECGGNLLIFY